MNRFKYIMLCIVSFILVTILQINIINKIQVFNVSANIFIIYLVYINILNDDDIINSIMSIVTGLLYDLCFGTVIGIYGLLGFLLSIITPILCKRISMELRIGIMLYVFITTFWFEAIYGIIYLFLNNCIIDLYNYILNILVTSIFNMTITMCIHHIFSNKIKEKNETNKIVRRY